MYVPDITRLFKGAGNEFEVEIVFAEQAGSSPKESHPFHEVVVVTSGSITVERSDGEKTRTNSQYSLIEIPAGVEHVISSNGTPTKIVIIHPNRKE